MISLTQNRERIEAHAPQCGYLQALVIALLSTVGPANAI